MARQQYDRFNVGLLTTGAAAAAAYAAIVTPAAASRWIAIRSISIIVTAATASSIGLVRAATQGTAIGTPTTGAANRAGSPSAPRTSSALFPTAWSAAPTISGTPIFLKRADLPATPGANVTWDFERNANDGYGDQDLIVDKNSALLIWNYGAGAGSVLDVNITYDELRDTHY